MVKGEKNYRAELREKMRDGDGSIKIEHLLEKDELGGNVRLCGRLTILPGCSIGYHEHNDEAEIFYIAAGQGVVNDNGLERQVSQGDTVLTKDAGHAIKNSGDTPLVVIAFIVKCVD